MNSPKRIGNGISRYHIIKEDIIGCIPDKKTAYDKMEMILVTINDDETDDDFLKKMQILLSKKITAEEKANRLHKEYGITIGANSREVLNSMCNLSDDIYDSGVEEGIKRGEQKGIAAFVELVNDKILTLEEAAKRLDMPVSVFKSYM